MNTATHPLRCRCGRLQGHVTLEGRNTRVVCYCKDCQAFARFLDPAGRALDAQSAVNKHYLAACKTNPETASTRSKAKS